MCHHFSASEPPLHWVSWRYFWRVRILQFLNVCFKDPLSPTAYNAYRTKMLGKVECCLVFRSCHQPKKELLAQWMVLQIDARKKFSSPTRFLERIADQSNILWHQPTIFHPDSKFSPRKMHIRRRFQGKTFFPNWCGGVLTGLWQKMGDIQPSTQKELPVFWMSPPTRRSWSVFPSDKRSVTCRR